MSMPSAIPAGPQKWVRGPTARRPAQASVVADFQMTPAKSGYQPAYGHGFVWVGAHGGAGASTLARALGGVDLGRRWPDVHKGDPGRMLLVARTHASGIQAASEVLDRLRRQEHPAGTELLAVVLVADAPGNLPAALSRRIRVLRSAVRTHRIPWIPAWRTGQQTPKPPKAVLELAELAGVQPSYAKGLA